MTAIETPRAILGVEDVAGRDSPLLVIDLAMPRAVASAVGDAPHVRRVDIADLRDRVERALGDRHEAVDRARELVGDDVERFLADQRARGAAGIVSDLRAFFDEIVVAELSRHDAEMSAAEKERVEAVVRAVVAKIAHRPTVALKDAAGTDRGARLTEAARTLFDL